MAGVGGREHEQIVVFAPAAQAVDGASQRELRCAETRNEIAATDLALFFECLQNGVDPGESTLVAFTKCGFTGQHAITLEQLHRAGVGRRGRRWSWFE